MVQIVIGILFIIVGVTTGMQDNDIQFILTGILIGAALILWGYRSRKRRLDAKATNPEIHEIPVPQDAPIAKTFSFKVTGTTHQCRFPKRPGTERSYVIGRHRVGDAVYPRLFEWEGKPAVAIMSVKETVDVGVVPASLTLDVVELMEQYEITGTIISTETFTYRGEQYNGCEVQLICREKEA